MQNYNVFNNLSASYVNISNFPNHNETTKLTSFKMRAEIHRIDKE